MGLEERERGVIMGMQSSISVSQIGVALPWGPYPSTLPAAILTMYKTPGDKLPVISK